MAFAAVLLDLDGTVWDSIPWYARLLSGETGGAAEEYIAELRDGGNIIGLLRTCGVSRNRFTRLCAREAGALPLFPGSRDGIEGLARLRVPLATVTSLSGSLAEPMLTGTGLRDYFGSTVYAARKSSGDPILTALAELGVKPGHDCLYVGDRPEDAACARHAGISFAWASYGYAADHPEPAAPALRGLDDLLKP